ncbi:hypothetical protein M426DRAFT_27428 [Hypoxylon sp. CI-4A]|nr:hypothetical protein M426DRAFT_27428 [Hypoxylon sp. CI-4A]
MYVQAQAHRHIGTGNANAVLCKIYGKVTKPDVGHHSRTHPPRRSNRREEDDNRADHERLLSITVMLLWIGRWYNYRQASFIWITCKGERQRRLAKCDLSVASREKAKEKSSSQREREDGGRPPSTILPFISYLVVTPPWLCWYRAHVHT